MKVQLIRITDINPKQEDHYKITFTSIDHHTRQYDEQVIPFSTVRDICDFIVKKIKEDPYIHFVYIDSRFEGILIVDTVVKKLQLEDDKTLAEKVFAIQKNYTPKKINTGVK